jgi:hypothetical protein
MTAFIKDIGWDREGIGYIWLDTGNSFGAVVNTTMNFVFL